MSACQIHEVDQALQTNELNHCNKENDPNLNMVTLMITNK